ncbi:MAG: dephospho-CoA kinase [Pontiella sp.]|nr:dephospho-CoA kinase [Pontiella sp.]
MSDTQRNTLVIGLTGGIACGKSIAGKILESLGFDVCDSDVIAHDLMAQGTGVYRRVVEHFGERILSGTGEIDRAVLGQIVFNHPEQLEKLNGLVHPAVRDTLAAWISEKRETQQNAAVQIPLLFESGMDSLDWDAVFCISATEDEVLRRLKARGLSAAEAMQRIQAQMPLKEKEKRSDCIIPNDGTLKDFTEAIEQAVQKTAVRKG